MVNGKPLPYGKQYIDEADIYAVIKRGLPPTMMAGYDGRVPDTDIWSIVNYLRSLAPQKPAR